MSQSPPLQTVATLTGGTSPVMQQAFFWGIPGQPFSVGTRGDWVVNAPGVEPLHFFLNFDGRMIQVAGGPSGAPVTVAGVPVDHTWRPVPVFAEIAFGGARMRITCEEAPQEAATAQSTVPVPAVPEPVAAAPAVPVPVVQVAAAPPQPAAFEGAPAHTPRTPDRIPYERPSPLKTQPLGPAAQQHTPFTSAGASGSQPPPGVVPTLHSMSAPASHSRSPSAAPPAVIALPGSSFSPVPAMPTAGIPGSAFVPVPPAPAAGFHAQPHHPDEGAVSTVSDAGALRALADRVQAEPGASSASAEAYFAEVQRAAVGQVPAAGSPAPRQAQHPSTAPPAFGVGGTRIILGAPTQDAAPREPDPPTKSEKPKTSWVMRVVLMLLPIAGYFAIFWEPPVEAPAPPEVQSTSTEASSTSTGSARAPSASAQVPERASAEVPTVVPPPSAAASASNAVPLPASSAPVVAPAAASAAPAATSAAPAGIALPTSRQARDALNAAFEGNLEDAAQRYEKLAAGPDGETYRVSARLIRERALRKP
jgi:hypothetical protein